MIVERAVTSSIGPDDVLHEVGDVAEQVAHGAAAGELLLEPPRQRALGLGGVAVEEHRPDVGDPAEGAVGDQLAHALDRRGVAVVVADGGGDAGLAGGGGDLGGLPGVAADGLLDPERLARLRGGDADLAVQHVRRADRDDVDVGVVEDLAVVGGAALVAQHVLGVLDAVGGGVGGDHQAALEAELGVDRGHGLVGAGVQLAHPADADQAHTDLTGSSHDRNLFSSEEERGSAEPELLGQPGLVLGAQALDGLVLRHLGGGDVPPRARAGQVDVRDHRDDDDDRALVAAGLVERRAHLGGGVRPDARGRRARRDLHEVDLEVVAVQPRLRRRRPAGRASPCGSGTRCRTRVPWRPICRRWITW